jgi:hypothetical protein
MKKTNTVLNINLKFFNVSKKFLNALQSGINMNSFDLTESEQILKNVNLLLNTLTFEV